MPEPIDAYADQFQASTGPFGASLSFLVSPPTPGPPGTVPQAERVATIRTSIEHLKVMAFMLHHQVMLHERNLGVEVQVPAEVLNGLQIGPEDWESFWRR